MTQPQIVIKEVIREVIKEVPVEVVKHRVTRKVIYKQTPPPRPSGVRPFGAKGMA